MANKIRLADVAEKAGVSTATVSRVLNGKSTVAAATKKRVLDTLDELGVDKPENLTSKTASLVGIVTPELTNPITPHFVQELARQLSARGLAPIVSVHTTGGTEDHCQALISHGVGGVIFLGGLNADGSRDAAQTLSASDMAIPYVTINGWNPTIGVPDFSADDSDGVKDAVRHLYHAGHRQIGLATGPERFRSAQDMAIGYRQAMMELCPGSDQHVMHSLFSVEGGQAAADQLLDRGATGIIFGSDVMALGAIRQIRHRGLSVPKDVSIIGCDDSPLMAFTDPPLTSTRQPIDQIVSGAVGTLVELMTDGNPPRVPMKYRTELITRDSSGSAPA